ncbi:MAG: 3-phosphoshikimate 1-carboxyvinyltransferase [Parcubacteria group bacterium GW2011_GWA2_44_12]|nr:MAG: 3-phosphoshikimate 1-carboxyvinyltransferase [Parcubacteria group bacterium GW2011_GWA2_44_12]
MSDCKVRVKFGINADINVPSSKSYTNRAYIISSLADGKSLIKNVLVSEDTLYMQKALSSLGVSFEKIGDDVIVKGGVNCLKPFSNEIYVGNSGTCLRFLTPFCALINGKTVLTGSSRLKERPMTDLLGAIPIAGISAVSKQSNGFAPIIIDGRGTILGGTVRLSGEISSQCASALLLCAPYASRDIEIFIKGELTSKPYVDMTLDIMKDFGASVERDGYKRFFVKAGAHYQPREYSIEGDYSSAGYFFAAAALTGGVVKVRGLKPNSKQGDAKMLSLLEQMGCAILKGEDFVEVRGPQALKPVTADMNACPDMAMTIAVLAAFAEGKTTIKNVYNIRLKECDRLAATVQGLKTLGVFVEALDDGMMIHGSCDARAIHGGAIDTYNDHRIAMSFALAGLRIPGVIIRNKECVSKTFPNFWECFERLYG